jgi:hypothetical protein
LLQNTNLPFTTRVVELSLPPKFKVSQMDAFDGFKDPVKHIEKYKAHMTVHGVLNEIGCKAFS